MTVTWLGQAGLLFKADGKKIMIDPYFSDSVGKIDSKKHRRAEVLPEFLELKPDIMLFTHAHLDHYDPETVKHFINEKSKVLVLAPSSVWEKVRGIGGDNNFVLFNRHTEWTEGKLGFTAVRAEHSDPTPIGIIIEFEGKKLYITGDTLYNEEIFSDLPNDIDTLFLPVNGVGNNMNMSDAARFAKRVNPNTAYPIHVGMFDDISPCEWSFENKKILKIYEEIEL